MKKLTHQFVNNVTKPGRSFYLGNNLHLLVRQGKYEPKKYFNVRLARSGRRIDRSLGTFPEVALSEARKLATQFMAKVNSGEPIDVDRTHQLTEPTFKEFTLDWIELNKGQWTNHKHYCQWLRTMEEIVIHS